MNKTVNINLAGVFFHIDEDAYLKLSRYLEAIKRSFTDSQGRSEIIADIEARIAELFSERIQNDKQVVGIKLVDEVIGIMGQPEDYLVDDEIFEDQPNYSKQQRTKSGPTKKLYRDTDNSYIGGVAAGLSHYLGIDMIWVRLLWVLFALMSGGTFTIIYLVFWALVPEAGTTAEKLTMTGEAVNISNIEKKIKDGIDTVSEKLKNVDFKKHGDNIKEGFENVADNISDAVKGVDFEKQGNRLKTKSRNFFETLSDIFMFFFKIFAKFFGVIMIIVGIATLLSLLVGFFTVGVTNAIHFPGMDFIQTANAANIPLWLMSCLLFLAIGIPFFFIFYLGLRILVSNLKSIGNPAKFTLLGLWIISILGLFVVGIRQASEHAYDAEIASKEELYVRVSDSLIIKMNDLDRYNNKYSYRNSGMRIVEEDDGQKMLLRDVRFRVFSTKDSVASISVLKNADGSSYSLAKKRAEAINYDIEHKNGVLLLDRYLRTDTKYKISDQSVEVIINIPEGTTLLLDENTGRYQRYSRNGILSNIIDGYYYKVLDDDVKCLDCPIEDEDEDDLISNDTSVKIDTEEGVIIKSGDTITLNINSESLKPSKSDIQVNIDEENGIEIKSNNDN